MRQFLLEDGKWSLYVQDQLIGRYDNLEEAVAALERYDEEHGTYN